MEYDTRTYFEENDADEVTGFTIIAAHSGIYHIAEKWSREDADNKWLQYRVPEEQLLARVEDGKCQEKATLSDEQFETVCDKIDHDGVSAAPA